MDGFPSGQREQTVNLPAPLSVVRIHPRPPEKRTTVEVVLFFLRSAEDDEQDFSQENLVREPTRSVSSKSCRIAGNRYPLRLLFAHSTIPFILNKKTRQANLLILGVFFGLPERTRTADLGSRSPVCYPAAPQVVIMRKLTKSNCYFNKNATLSFKFL